VLAEAPAWLLGVVHLLALVLAQWRLTEAILYDQVFAWARKRWPGYPVECARCISFWTGAALTAVWYVWPWALWPLALSWGYLWMAIARDPTTHL
jgi:hypothetical protein